MGKCKTKATETDSGIIRHIQELFRHIQAYSETCELWHRVMVYAEPWHIHQKHIQNPDIFTTLVYPELRYIQSAGIFKIRGIFF